MRKNRILVSLIFFCLLGSFTITAQKTPEQIDLIKTLNLKRQ